MAVYGYVNSGDSISWGHLRHIAERRYARFIEIQLAAENHFGRRSSCVTDVVRPLDRVTR
jgi:hypothetical protein